VLSKNILLAIALAPLAGAAIAGLFGRQVGRAGAHWATILGVATSCVLSVYVLKQLAFDGVPAFNQNVYTFFEIGGYSAHVGFLVDRLTATMMVVVTFVSLLVHVYTIGYMAEDPGYQRFFSYISLFTFAMLMLVMSNNFLQLFFGWEAVGLVSYLLIGFWFKRPTAIFANLKAFLVNRVGDFGFLLGIAGVLAWLGTLDYATAFANAGQLQGKAIELLPGVQWDAATFVCICLFIGAMGKSAQVPLHVWLPDSMEGPTPISALIHAATMVTAGIFMVSRMSPLFELSATALAFVLFIGATTALFTGLIGIVQNDIKRVVAYSTLSQLGYMTVALGVSAYSAAIFHLVTHAFFKALLFLAAGSVIIAMHHEQDMRHMGGLRKYMPVTFATAWIGTLALVGTPFFSGFYSKDAIIEAVKEAAHGGGWVQQYALWAVLAGVFVTAFYSFRLLYLAFHGKERFVVDAQHEAHADGAHGDLDDHGHQAPGHLAHAPHETPWVVTLPLVLLAIPSVALGFFAIRPLLFGDWFAGAIAVDPTRDVVAKLGAEFHGPLAFALHGFQTPAFWLAFAGFAAATFLYLLRPDLPPRIAAALRPLVTVLAKKYWFDEAYQAVFARGSLLLGRGLWKGGDVAVIDGGIVNGSAAVVARAAGLVRLLQSGYLYHYAFAMILGLIALLGAFVWSR
jgi:NADH-quinone oxidoreductase subunit L